jgi:hypothetical protein
MILRRREGRSGKVLRSMTRRCILCNEDTPHDVIMVKIRPRHGRLRWQVRILDLCKQCGSHRIATKQHGPNPA